MAEGESTKFVYRNTELYKSKSLGSGAYGGVCKARCDGLICAAKIMHPTLFDLRDPGTASYLSKFREECHLLSLARHPNVVQYLGTYTDPDTQLPVLLMELCQESLTAYLERSPGPLPYHVQVDICHDIVLALVYLHSNGLIHRDLTGNNVLIIAGPRAKITDFGMSKLASVNTRMTTLTQCPGNMLYMSPEALDEAKTYTAKLDVFSFGIIVIQILTRKFPNPTDRFRTVPSTNARESDDDDEASEVRQVVPESERRESHLKLIPDTHPLKSLALQCLKKKESRRPSALELNDRLSELKSSPQYTESREQSENGQDTQPRESSSELERVLSQKNREIQECHLTIEAKDMEIQAKERELHTTKREVQEQKQMINRNEQAFERKDLELQKVKQDLQASEQLVAEFQQSLEQKEKIISDQKIKICQLQQQHDSASRTTSQQQPSPVSQQAIGASRKPFSKMRSVSCGYAPEAMYRGAMVAHGNKAYFRPFGSGKIYSYSYFNVLQSGKWSELPPITIIRGFGLAVVGGLLTSVGGWNDGPIGTLMSFNSEMRVWSEIYPPMPTARSSSACVTIGSSLVVMGGLGSSQEQEKWCDVVEVMNTDTKQWSTVDPLPYKFEDISAVVFEDKIYLAGGVENSVITCSLPDLLQRSSTSLAQKLRKMIVATPPAWKVICSLPVIGSTLVSFGDDLLAIGGRDDAGELSASVFSYNSQTDTWTGVKKMWNKRSRCLAVPLSEIYIVVVGGFNEKTAVGYSATTNIEIYM